MTGVQTCALPSINIKKTRFSDHLNFYLEIEKGLENVLVPNMLIQPIIENSIKHGYGKKHTTLDVFLKIKKRNGLLIIFVENNGRKLDKKQSILFKSGNGLMNLKDRLVTLYGNKHKLKIYNRNNRVITKICFPIQISVAEIAQTA